MTSDVVESKPTTGVVRPIRREDNAAVAELVRAVLTEFGCTGPGYAINDPELDSMYETYRLPRSAYFVAEFEGKIVGGGGIAPLKGGAADICEVQKYYVLSSARGKGFGRKLLMECLKAARRHGYARCYLETVPHMQDARELYMRNGFAQIAAPMGKTGHTACTCWYLKEL